MLNTKLAVQYNWIKMHEIDYLSISTSILPPYLMQLFIYNLPKITILGRNLEQIFIFLILLDCNKLIVGQTSGCLLSLLNLVLKC